MVTGKCIPQTGKRQVNIQNLQNLYLIHWQIDIIDKPKNNKDNSYIMYYVHCSRFCKNYVIVTFQTIPGDQEKGQGCGGGE